MKKKAILIATLLSMSCQKGIDIKMENNFNIIIENRASRTNVAAKEYMRVYDGDSVKVLFNINKKEVISLFRVAKENNIFDIEKNYSPSGYCGTYPFKEMKITLINGKETRYFTIANCTYFFGDNRRVKRIHNLIDALNEILYSKEEIKSMPLSDSFLE